MSYDSRPDTYEHIAKVRGNVLAVVEDLLARADAHDMSKLAEPELSMFDEFTPKLAQMDYGSDEYKASLDAMRATGGLDHHYEVNDHHPEHFPNGVSDMNLIQIIEMLADWKAATERHAQSDDPAQGSPLMRSIKMNAARYGYSPELKQILINTANYMGWL